MQVSWMVGNNNNVKERDRERGWEIDEAKSWSAKFFRM